MIVQLLLVLVFTIIDSIIAQMPEGFVIPDWISSVTGFFKGVGYFFPKNSVGTLISVLITWAGIYFIWIFIHWIIRKIPGMN